MTLDDILQDIYALDDEIRAYERRYGVLTETFYEELSSARTFILKHEAQWLRDQGLGERVTCSDLLVFNETGPVGNALRFPDECVRHKALDLVGDLALAGCDIQGRLVACRGGHRLNAQLVRALLGEPVAAGQCRRSA